MISLIENVSVHSQTRNQRCNEMRLDRQLLERLLATWKKIKDVRRTNGYTTTAVRLIIKQYVRLFVYRLGKNLSCRISGKKIKHYEQIQQQIEQEIEDEIALADEEYQRAKATHSESVKKRKLQSIRRVKSQRNLSLKNFIDFIDRKRQENVWIKRKKRR